jgi:hypothetical protein
VRRSTPTLKGTMSEWLALVSATTALAAVVLSPLVAMWAAERQSRVAVLSANRQSWINALRDLIAECMSISGLIHLADWSSRPQAEYDAKMERLSFLIAKIRLMLNPKEEDHQRLTELLGELLKSMKGLKAQGNKDSAAGARAVRELVPLSQIILKREWERVKQMV